MGGEFVRVRFRSCFANSARAGCGAVLFAVAQPAHQRLEFPIPTFHCIEFPIPTHHFIAFPFRDRASMFRGLAGQGFLRVCAQILPRLHIAPAQREGRPPVAAA